MISGNCGIVQYICVTFLVLKKAFDSFDSQKSGSISAEMVGTILRLMGQPFNDKILRELIAEVDEDGNGDLKQ